MNRACVRHNKEELPLQVERWSLATRNKNSCPKQCHRLIAGAGAGNYG